VNELVVVEVLMNKGIVSAEWLSYKDAERFVGLGRTTLWQLVNSGEIQAARVGRAVRINKESLATYLERNPASQTTQD
jgi:excisionase family DNA binding protein